LPKRGKDKKIGCPVWQIEKSEPGKEDTTRDKRRKNLREIVKGLNGTKGRKEDNDNTPKNKGFGDKT